MNEQRVEAALYRMEAGMSLLSEDTTVLSEAYRELEAERDELKAKLEAVERLVAQNIGVSIEDSHIRFEQWLTAGTWRKG